MATSHTLHIMSVIQFVQHMYERTAATFFIIPPQFLRTYIIEGGLQLSKVRDVSGGADILKISQHCHKEYLNL